MFRKGSWLVCLTLIAALVFALGASAQVRNGAWVDEVIFTEEANSTTAVTRLDVGEIDLYSYTVTDASCSPRCKPIRTSATPSPMVRLTN